MRGRLMDFGARTPVTLHGLEQVITVEESKAVAKAVDNYLNCTKEMAGAS